MINLICSKEIILMICFIGLIVSSIIYLIISKKSEQNNPNVAFNSFNIVASLSISIILVGLYSLIIKYITNTKIPDGYSFRLVIDNYPFLLSIIILFLILFITSIVYFTLLEELNKGFKEITINIVEKVGLTLLSSSLVIAIKDVFEITNKNIAIKAMIVTLVFAIVAFTALIIVHYIKIKTTKNKDSSL